MKTRSVSVISIGLAFAVVWLAAGLAGLPAQADSRSDRYREKYGRTEPFVVNYQRGRTWQRSYRKDPNFIAAADLNAAEILRKCHRSEAFDFPVGDYDQEASKRYLQNETYRQFDVIVVVNIELQKLFVFDRSVYRQTGGKHGLRFAWKTSTGYHDKHWGWAYKLKRIAHGQKGRVDVKMPSIEHARRTLAKSRDKDKIKIRVNSRGTVYLRYTDYFKTEPGHYIIRSGFSSRHISGEYSDGTSTEVPTMPYALFFNLQRGMAIHGAAYRGTLGSTGSHGCVRLKEENACRLFHLVGHTEYVSKDSGKLRHITQKTGRVTDTPTSGHRALVIVQDGLHDWEKKYLPLFLGN